MVKCHGLFSNLFLSLTAPNLASTNPKCSSLRMYLNNLVIKCENEELWALRDGINECIELNLPAVEIELDAKLVVDLLMKADGNLNSNDVIVTRKFRGSKSHIPLEKLTNVLMRLLKEELYFLKILLFFISLADVFLLLRLDAAGTLFEHVCSSVSVV